MLAREVMTESPICCTPSESVQSIARKMADNNCGLLPVVDDISDMHLIGVISDRDIVCRVLADGADCSVATASAAMTAGPLWTVNPDTSLDDVLDMMEEGQVRRIPVVDADNRILGIIATADIALELEDDPEDVAEVIHDISEPSNIPHA